MCPVLVSRVAGIVSVLAKHLACLCHPASLNLLRKMVKLGRCHVAWPLLFYSVSRLMSRSINTGAPGNFDTEHELWINHQYAWNHTSRYGWFISIRAKNYEGLHWTWKLIVAVSGFFILLSLASWFCQAAKNYEAIVLASIFGDFRMILNCWFSSIIKFSANSTQLPKSKEEIGILV